MRDVFLVVVVFGILVRTIGAPQAGILGWTWLTLMTPQKLVWGYVTTWQLNLVVAIVTLIAWLASREPKRLPINAATVLLILFMAYVTITTFFGLAPDLAWGRWNLAIKVMILGLMISSIMTTQVRVHALVWVAVLSLGYFGVKGGAFTLLTGGRFRVLPAGESIGDSNNLALALCMILPLMNYLRLQSGSRLVRSGIIAAMALTVFGVLGTYSRGGLVGLTIMSTYLWWQSKNRITVLLVVLAIAVPAYKFMPTVWTERMGSIETANTDDSFQERLQAWRTEFNIAKAHPLTGGGFNASENPFVYRQYAGDPNGWARAAHSIYFEVLGDHGFIGFALYLALLIATWGYLGATRRKASREPELRWVVDLASMAQVSLVSFMVAGAALSMAYYDMFYILVGVAVVLRQIALKSPARIGVNSPLATVPLARPAG